MKPRGPRFRLEATPPNETKALVFTSPEALREWAAKELEFWTPLASALSAQPHPRQWSAAESAMKRLQLLGNEVTPTDAEPQLAAVLQSLLITSRDPRAQFLQTLQSQGEEPSIIGSTFQALLDPSQVSRLIGNNRWGAAAIQALAYRAAWAAFPSRDRLTEVKAASDTMIGEVKQVLAGIQDEHSTALVKLGQFEAVAASALDEAEKRLAEAETAFASSHTELKNRLSVDLALRAPVEYWTAKSDRHRNDAKTFRHWFAGLAVGGLVVTALLAALWLVPAMEENASAWWALVLFSALLALWAWPLRLTSKLYLAHTHLAEDATEREVITKTFLALGEAVDLTADDRHLLLAALFRSSSAGLVRDEGTLSMADLVIARVAGKE